MLPAPPTQSFFWTFLGLLFRFLYVTATGFILGVSLRFIIKGAGLIALLLSWWNQWGMGLLVVLLVLNLAIWWAYWWAKRVGYRRFVPADMTAVPAGKLVTMPPKTAVPLLATGVFGLATREQDVLLCPAEYWQTVGGDHVIVARSGNREFMYQFFNATSLQKIEPGWLIHGRELHATLALTFKVIWGPELEGKVHFVGGVDYSDFKAPARTIYMTFPEPAAGTKVWHHIVADARQARKRPLSD